MLGWTARVVTSVSNHLNDFVSALESLEEVKLTMHFPLPCSTEGHESAHAALYVECEYLLSHVTQPTYHRSYASFLSHVFQK